MTVGIDHTTTSGTFSLDGGTWEVENNVWVIGDAAECVIIDAPHQAGPIMALVGDRRVSAILCTHAHDDHVTVAAELSRHFAAPVWLHPADEQLWRRSFPDEMFLPLVDGQQIEVGDVGLEVLHTPGHSQGAVCFYLPALSTLFSGDTLFRGGPGATGRSFSSFDTIIESISSRLLSLPAETAVKTGHGADTQIGLEAPHLQDWITRGH